MAGSASCESSSPPLTNPPYHLTAQSTASMVSLSLSLCQRDTLTSPLGPSEVHL